MKKKERKGEWPGAILIGRCHLGFIGQLTTTFSGKTFSTRRWRLADFLLLVVYQEMRSTDKKKESQQSSEVDKNVGKA